MDGPAEDIPSKCDRIHVEPGDVLHFNTWGGGGWGDPLKPRLFQTELPGLQDEVHQYACRRVGDEDSAGSPGRALGRSFDQLCPADL
jgi:N-methylhydantoinase B